MNRKLVFTQEATQALQDLRDNPAKAGLYKQVCKTLGLLETNLKHPSLNTHEYHSLSGENGEKVWEAYAQNKTPGAYRVFFHYGKDMTDGDKKIPVLTIIAITPHP